MKNNFSNKVENLNTAIPWPQSFRKTRQKEEMNLQATSANPLFRKVREFKKDLINNKLKEESAHASRSGTSIHDIHFSLNINDKPKIQSELLHLLSKQSTKVDTYLEVLENLYDDNQQSYNEEETKRIEELCYAGVGKSLVETKKIIPPSYSRVNLLIREFMIDAIQRDTLSVLKEQNPYNIYVQTNAKGLGYKTVLQPQFKHFSKIIDQCNKIIQEEFLFFKKKKQPKVKTIIKVSSYLNILGIFLLCLYFFINLFSHLVTIILAALMLLAGVGSNLTSLVIEQRKELKDSNVIDRIQKMLENYLENVNQSEQMNGKYEWRCGKDFYWLEILPLNNDFLSLKSQ